MEREHFDVIVVGAGPAGSSAAYRLAKAGKSVLLIERGNYGGAKNMMGGRIYTHSLEKLIPNFRDIAPLERKVVKEKISILQGEQATSFEYTGVPKDNKEESYVILRAKFDRWLQGEAEKAGALVINGIQVTDVIKDNGNIIGVQCGADQAFADLVIIAEGANSLLAEKASLKETASLRHMALGVKEVYKLPQINLEERLGLEGQDGCAWLSLGDMTDGLMGGGFIYSNKDSLSIGLVVGLDSLGQSQASVDQMMEAFTSQRMIRPLLKDAKLVERSAHLVPEGSYDSLPSLGGIGYLLVGDAAGFCINLGYTVRGIDFAIASGMMAADAYIKAKEVGFIGSTITRYQKAIEYSFVGQDMKLYNRMSDFLNDSPRIFQDYPQLVNDIMHDIFRVDDKGAQPLLKKILMRLNQVGLSHLGRDMMKGVRSL